MLSCVLIAWFAFQSSSVFDAPKAPQELIEAAERGNLTAIRAFASHAGFSNSDGKGRNVLIAAGQRGQKAAFGEVIAIVNEYVKQEVARLLKEGQPAVAPSIIAVQHRLSLFNSRDQDGATPLMFAAGRGWDDLVRALLDAGADPAPQDQLGRSAADHAADAGFEGLAVSLRSATKN